MAIKTSSMTGSPEAWSGNDRPDAREGQAGRPGVAERLVVPLKPGNAGGGLNPYAPSYLLGPLSVLKPRAVL